MYVIDDIESRSTGKVDIVYAGFFLGLMIALVIANFWYVAHHDTFDKLFISYTGEIRILSQSIAKNANEAVDGNFNAFEQLKQRVNEFEYYIDILQRGSSDISGDDYIPATPQNIRDVELFELEKEWNKIKQRADLILTNQTVLLSLVRSLDNLVVSIGEIKQEFIRVMKILIDEKAPQNQIGLIAEQLLYIEGMLRDIDGLRQVKSDSRQIADRFNKNITSLEMYLDVILFGSNEKKLAKITNTKARMIIDTIKTKLYSLKGTRSQIMRSAAALSLARSSATEIFMYSKKLLSKATSLKNAYANQANERYINPTTGYILSFLCLINLGVLSFLSYKNTKNDLKETEAQNAANEKDISELVEEISDLADGNLTTYATIKNSITGAIAESINYTINALRKLVFTINETSVQASTAAQDVQATARQLAEASDNQAQEIVGATASINAMVASIEHVSHNAAKSSIVAAESVGIAKKGVEVVHDMILGMSEIGRQIQETSKRIKRLGESSQEIGDTVSLIDDITDQTNILSLNAAIQAAMAGEAGRGFAVVADEVQRLAERSSHATKEIESLVKTIQSDTNQTVESMEHTTAEVVQGAKLVEDAGVALEKIEEVSSNLAELIQSISDEGKQQTATSSKIYKNMEVIQNIAVQTASGTSNAANAISYLADIVNELRNSVAGFKLPVEVDDL